MDRQLRLDAEHLLKEGDFLGKGPFFQGGVLRAFRRHKQTVLVKPHLQVPKLLLLRLVQRISQTEESRQLGHNKTLLRRKRQDGFRN